MRSQLHHCSDSLSWRTPLLFAVVILANASIRLLAQTQHTLSIEGPTILHGPAGGVARGLFHVTLLTQGPIAGEGVEGWSFALQASGGRITAIGVSGTDGQISHAGGVEQSFLVGSTRAVSSATLPSWARFQPGLLYRLARIEVEVDLVDDENFPPPPQPLLSLELLPELEGPQGLIRSSVRVSGQEVAASLRFFASIRPYWDAYCTTALGFSREALESPTPFAGLVGGESAVGEIVVEVPRGETGSQHVFVNLVMNLSDRPSDRPLNFGGWSFSIAAEGQGDCAALTTAATILGSQVGFKKTECVDLAKNFGRKGAVSGSFFSDPPPGNVPTTGTFSALDLLVQADGPQGIEEKVVRLSFQNGLRGSGQPIQNGLAIDGSTVVPCNTFEAALTLRFRLNEGRFLRGNPNHDDKVDISDAVWILSELFLWPAQTTCLDAADVNDDGKIDITDSIYLLNFQFLGGRPVPPPYPACGKDPGDDDALDCAESPSAC